MSQKKQSAQKKSVKKHKESAKAAGRSRSPPPAVSSRETTLQTAWSIHWWRQQGDTSKEAFLNNLHTLGTIKTVEGFWRHYLHLQRPSQLAHGYNMAFFRADLEPAWESFPQGGCWIIRVPRRTRFLDGLWEELLMAVCGENFLTPELVGVVVSIRKGIANITIWNRDNSGSDVRFRIGERLKELLNLDEQSTVEYKFFNDAIHDGSTHRNATAYTYTLL